MNLDEYIRNYYSIDDNNAKISGKRLLYQPIYHHPEFNSINKAEDYEEKIDLIYTIINNYHKKLKKNKIKILDIGSAEGYIDFILKEKLGDKVEIICYEKYVGAINICNEIKKETNLSIEFNKAEPILSIIDKHKNDSIDIMLLFNVLHWISIEEGGFRKTVKLLEKLASNSNMLLIELAGYDKNNTERCPRNYDDWFDNIKFYQKIAIFKHRYSDMQRPLFIASNMYVYISNIFYKIDNYIKSFEGMRRAFISDNILIKIVYKTYKNRVGFNTSPEDCIKEMRNEICNCDKGISFLPTVINYYDLDDYFILCLNLKKIGVRNLTLNISDCKNSYNKIINILDNLIELESNNLYHYDLTVLNIMETNEGEAFLIDYGAIINKNKISGANLLVNIIQKDVYNSYDAFVGVLVDYFTSNNKHFDFYISNYFIPTIFYNEDLKLPKRIKNFLIKYQSTDRKKLSFILLKEMFIYYVIDNNALDISDYDMDIYNLEYEKRRSIHDRIILYIYQEIVKKQLSLMMNK